MARRAVATIIGLVVLLLLLLGLRTCQNARQERAYKDYVDDVTGLVRESDQQSQALFELLSGGTQQSAVDVQNSLNTFRGQADQLAERTRGVEHPDELGRAQRFLVEALAFRHDGIAAIADELPNALGDEGRPQAARSIAAEMQNFLASDVLYSQRAVPALEQQLHDEDLLDETNVPRSRFLPDIGWLEPATVADRIEALRGERGDEEAAPGIHGTGLGAVTVQPGGATLTRGSTPTIPASEELAFQVELTNQGEHPEQDVTVTISLDGAGAPVKLEESIDEIAAGQTEVVTIPLADTPPTGERVAVKVGIEAVPGEENTDNNSQTFSAIFTL